VRDGNGVTTPAQFFRGAFHFPGRPRSPALWTHRPFGFGQLQRAFRRFAFRTVSQITLN